jgi:hypothetical protein
MRRNPTPTPGTLVKFTPTAFKNDTDSTPIVVWVRAPSEAEKRTALVDYVDKPAPTFAVQLEAKLQRVADWVDHVDNYESNAGVPIHTPAEFVTLGEHALLMEVADAVDRLFTLSVDERKNSDGSSALQLAATPVSVGTVPLVSPASCISGVTATEHAPGSST